MNPPRRMNREKAHRLAAGLGARAGPAHDPGREAPVAEVPFGAADAPTAHAAEVVKAAEHFKALLAAEGGKLSQVMQVLTTVRHLYAAARLHLRELVATDDAPPMAEDYAVKVAAQLAAGDTDFASVGQSLVKSVMPWLSTRAAELAEADRREAAEAQAAEEAEEALRPVDLGFPWSGVPEVTEVPAGKSVTFVGPPEALRAVAQKLAESVGGVPWLLPPYWPTPKNGPAGTEPVGLTPAHWRGCCDSRAKAEATYAALGRPHVLVCTDLPYCRTADYAGRPDGAKAGEAHKLLTAAGKGRGLILIGMVQSDRPPTSMEFETLRAFSAVVHVTLGEGGETAQVLL